MSLVETDTSKHGQVRELLLASVLDSVKQCQRYFGAGQGVATEGDHRVVNLLNSLDTCLSHGIKRKAGKLKQAFVRREDPGAFWPAVSEVLSDFQFERLKSVVQTEQNVDSSKANMGMVWLKLALNERNLQSVLTTLLSEKQVIQKFYDSHAFIRDEEKSSILPTSAAGLVSVIFALKVSLNSRGGSPPKPEDRKLSPGPIPGVSVGRNGESSPLMSHSVFVSNAPRQMTYKTDPLTQSEKISTFTIHSPSIVQPSSFPQGDFTPEPVMHAPAQELVKKEKSKRRSQKTVVQFDNKTEIVVRHKQKVNEWSDSLMIDTDKTPTGNNSFENITNDTFPIPNGTGTNTISEDTNLIPDHSDKSSLSDPEELYRDPKLFVGELSSSPEKHTSTLYTHGEGLLYFPAANQLTASTQEALNATEMALSASKPGNRGTFEEQTKLPPSQSLSEMPRGDLEALMVTVSKQNERVGDRNTELKIELEREQRLNGMLRDEIELEKSEMKMRGDELSMKLASISRENELLKTQLKKYVGMVQSMEIRESMGIPNALSPTSNISTEDTGDDEKIVQLSDMYGELMELNERLHKELIFKNRAIQCMQNTMLSIGIQVPTYDTQSVTVEGSNQFCSEGILKREFVKIWIPSAFLRGESHHVYQIYIRIHNDEWNVYRRYTEFHEFHQQLRKKVPAIEKFYFPPKKNIGRRDAKLVEERRQRLQSYLRFMVHILSQPRSPTKPALFNDNLNKHKFLELLPFFADPPGNGSGSNRGSRASSPATFQGGRRNSNQPPKSPTYTGL